MNDLQDQQDYLPRIKQPRGTLPAGSFGEGFEPPGKQKPIIRVIPNSFHNGHQRYSTVVPDTPVQPESVARINKGFDLLSIKRSISNRRGVPGPGPGGAAASFNPLLSQGGAKDGMDKKEIEKVVEVKAEVKKNKEKGISPISVEIDDIMKRLAGNIADLRREVETVFKHNAEIVSNYLVEKGEDLKRRTSAIEDQEKRFFKQKVKFQKDKREWQDYKKALAERVGGGDDFNIIKVEVGGTCQFAISLDKLTQFKESLLAEAFGKDNFADLQRVKTVSISPHLQNENRDGKPAPEIERIYLDRNGDAWYYIVDYLRQRGERLPVITNENLQRAFDEEVFHWGIESESFVRSKLPSLLTELMESEPLIPNIPDPSESPTAKLWNQIGSFSIVEFYRRMRETEFDNEKHFFSTFNSDQLQVGEYGYPQDLFYYYGQIDKSSGLPEGLGRRITVKNGRIIEGRFSQGVCRGWARIIFENGDHYIGFQEDSVATGRGKLVKKSGQVQEGEWQGWKFKPVKKLDDDSD